MTDGSNILYNSPYEVKTGVFEGPFDLLLSLIEKRKLFINDISLSKVTDDFIEYIHGQKDFPIKESSYFISIASTLMLIKSRSLLPTLTLSEEEEDSIEDLEKRLNIYRVIKNISKEIGDNFYKSPMFEGSGESRKPVFSPDPSISLESLEENMKDVISRIPTKDKMPQTNVGEMIKLESVIDNLIERISTGLEISFKEFSKSNKVKSDKKERVNVVVSFLAVLELVKRGIISVRQESKHGDIQMENAQIDTPNYN